jgi:murein DD-endopeptidase MepM/ murein hydrolase activator NlpD
MRALPWILGGGTVAAGLYYWIRRESDKPEPEREPDRPTKPTKPEDAPLPGRWVWPVGVWQGRKPEISDGFSSKRRTPAGDIITHGGVDIMYRRQPGDTWLTGTPNGTRNFVMPNARPALAASDGVVWFAANTPRGWTMIIDHAPRKLATYYTHLSSLLVTTKQKVSAGTPLGIIGADPLDGEHIMHLHFEVWRGGASDRFDPQPLMQANWEYLPDPGDQSPVPVARNATPGTSAYGVPVRAHTRRWPRR